MADKTTKKNDVDEIIESLKLPEGTKKIDTASILERDKDYLDEARDLLPSSVLINNDDKGGNN